MKYILFARKECPFCVKAQSLLKEKNFDHKVINFNESHKDILQEIKDAYSWNTVPMIFRLSSDSIEFIGGYTDLVKFLGPNG